MDDDRVAETFDETDITSLATKLATLELSEREQSALRALLSDEVAGFAGRFDVPGILGRELTSLRARGTAVFGVRARGGTGGTGVRATPGIPGTGGPRPL